MPEVIVPVRLHRDGWGNMRALVVEREPGVYEGYVLRHVAAGPDLAIIDYWAASVAAEEDNPREGDA